MHRDFTLQKRAILLVLGLFLAADVGLAIYSWRLASSPHTPQAEFDEQNTKLSVLRGDIHSAQRIKENMPFTKQDCEKFEKSLPLVSASSSAIESEFDDIAKKSNLRIDALTSHPKEIADRGITEISIEATVTGDYGSVVRFVNGLQRSQRFYVLDGLALATDAQNQAVQGPIRVALHLRTYFRDAA
jgi:Tfp pilus assembly protein PilO